MNRFYQTSNKKFYIAIDVDGTIVEHRFPDLGAEVPHAFDWLKKFQDEGVSLIMYTMRGHGNMTIRATGQVTNRDTLQEAIDFCKSKGIEFYGINNNPDQHVWTDSPKIWANYYIDDAAIGVPLFKPLFDRPYVDWKRVGPKVMKIIREYKKRETHG